METIESLKKTISELEKRNEELLRINGNLIRINKERTNSQKGQFPKKQHSGYCLYSSKRYGTQYYKGGNHKTAWVFESVFATPYDISLNYDDVLEAVYDDLFEEDENGKCIVDKLGLNSYYPDRTYAEFYEGNHLRDERNRLIEEYKERFNTYEVPEDAVDKIWSYTEEMLNQSFYNLNIRMSGKDGYWYVSFNHLVPLASIPPELRFPARSKKKKNGIDKEKTN